jgi:hypothetical protein
LSRSLSACSFLACHKLKSAKTSPVNCHFTDVLKLVFPPPRH